MKKPVFIENCKFWKTWLSNFGCCGNLNVDAVTRHNDYEIFPDKFWEKPVRLEVIAWTVFKLFNFKARGLKSPTPRS